MPPRKRAKASAASTPLAETQPKTPQETGPTSQPQTQTSPQDENLLNDPWTDDQETQLFKSMMKWKPTGIHKHFKMISIYSNMHSHGFVTDETPHTRLNGIWRKLHQLYDLQALDERENAHAFGDDLDPLDPDEAFKIPDFDLPEEDFGNLMWQKRFHSPDLEASSSPPLMPIEDAKLLYEPGRGWLKDPPEGTKSHNAESIANSTPPKNTKSTRASRAAAKSGKATKAGQAGKNSKAQSVEEDSADEGDDDDEDEEESVKSEEVTAPSTRRTNRSTGTAKPGPKTRKR